jgi:myo-inositol-1-phosphate synthase
MSDSTQGKVSIAAPTGRLGVLTPGMGAVATTFMAGVESIRRGLSRPIGSMTQLATIRLGKRSENRFPKIKDFVPLHGLDDLVFGGWDIFPEDTYEAARKAAVLRPETVEPIAEFLRTIRPMPAVFDKNYVKKLDGPNVKQGRTKADLACMLMDDIDRFRDTNRCERLIMIWCGSTEVWTERSAAHQSIEAFEKALEANDPAIAPSMIYAYAAIKKGVPYANGAPNLSADIPALEQLAVDRGVPISGKDFKTGQTLMKTILAPGLKARLLGLNGWFSTNILGNRDGEVLDDPGSFKTKEESKLSVLDTILQPDVYPELYGHIHHKVRIEYYPPRGDNKEGWDNLDIFGWLGYPMQIKVNFLCRDSILAAPIVLDLALYQDLAGRAGMAGVQDWLSFYFKSPHVPRGKVVEHDLFIQHTKLKNTLRQLMGEPLVTHVEDTDYADEG